MALRFPTLSVNFGSSGGLLFELHWVLTRTPDFVWNWRYVSFCRKLRGRLAVGAWRRRMSFGGANAAVALKVARMRQKFCVGSRA